MRGRIYAIFCIAMFDLFLTGGPPWICSLERLPMLQPECPFQYYSLMPLTNWRRVQVGGSCETKAGAVIQADHHRSWQRHTRWHYAIRVCCQASHVPLACL